jgi:WD40 repeat protein
LWDTGSGKPTGVVLRHKASIVAVGFSADSQVVVTATSQGTVQRWAANTGEPVGPAGEDADGGGSESCFSPDGLVLLTIHGDGTARLRDVATGRPLGPSLPHWTIAEAVAVGPAGTKLLTVLRQTNTAQIWDLPAPLAGAPEQVVCWAEVITGMRLDADGVVHLLDCAAWQQREGRLKQWGGATDR